MAGRRKSRIPHPIPPIDVGHAAELLERGFTYVEIGAKLGYRPSSVRRRLLESGFQPPPRRACRQERWGEKLYSSWRELRRSAAKGTASITPEWDSFDRFYDWAIASGYRPGLVLDRVVEHGSYSPQNCRWRLRVWRTGKQDEVPPKRTVSEGKWQRAERMLRDEGMSCYEIARRLEVPYTTLLCGLKRRGSYRPPQPKLTSTPTGRKLYKAWLTMHARCSDPGNDGYRYYGGQGARVCKEWSSFEPFYAWAVKKGWEPGLCLSRAGRARVFSPGNCEWVTRAEAAKKANHPSSRMPPRWTVQAFGETRGPTEWSRDPRCAVSLPGLLRRLRKGWPAEEAITTPPAAQTGPAPTRIVTAFGRTMGITEWSRDRRCKVTIVTLIRRLDAGMEPEVAITAAPFRAASRSL